MLQNPGKIPSQYNHHFSLPDFTFSVSDQELAYFISSCCVGFFRRQGLSESINRSDSDWPAQKQFGAVWFCLLSADFSREIYGNALLGIRLETSFIAFFPAALTWSSAYGDGSKAGIEPLPYDQELLVSIGPNGCDMHSHAMPARQAGDCADKLQGSCGVASTNSVLFPPASFALGNTSGTGCGKESIFCCWCS